VHFIWSGHRSLWWPLLSLLASDPDAKLIMEGTQSEREKNVKVMHQKPSKLIKKYSISYK
jgi:hypothetical protein